MRRTKEEAEATRKALLEAALKVFSRQGYANARLEDIAEEAGVTRGAIYHHFGGKDELVNALLTEASTRINRVIESAVTEGGTTLDILRRIFVQWHALTEEDEMFRAVNELIVFQTPATPELDEELRKQWEFLPDALTAISDGIRRGIEEGTIRADLDPHDVALAYLALRFGLVALWRVHPELFALQAQSRATVELFIRAIMAN